MPGSSEISMGITCHPVTFLCRVGLRTLPVLGQVLGSKACWPGIIFLSALSSFEPKTTCLIPSEIQQISGRKQPHLEIGGRVQILVSWKLMKFQNAHPNKAEVLKEERVIRLSMFK